MFGTNIVGHGAHFCAVLFYGQCYMFHRRKCMGDNCIILAMPLKLQSLPPICTMGTPPPTDSPPIDAQSLCTLHELVHPNCKFNPLMSYHDLGIYDFLTPVYEHLSIN